MKFLGAFPRWAIGSLLISGSLVQAGVLITRTQQIEVGNLIEGPQTVSLQAQYGAVDFKKENLLWYTADPAVNSLLKAGNRALKEGNRAVATLLYETSLSREPLTKNEAARQIEWIRSEEERLVQTQIDQLPPESPGTHKLPTPEEKIAQAQRMIDSAQELEKQTFLSNTTTEHFKSVAKNRLADGERLLAEGKQELAQKQAAEAITQQVEEAKRQEELLAEAERQRYLKGLSATPTERLVNMLTFSGIGLLGFLGVLFATFRVQKG